MSTVTKGEHMVPIMNDFGITCGMIGNHDLDYGNEHCIETFSKLNFPVLNTNILTPINSIASGTIDDFKLDLEPLGKCMREYIYKYNNNFNIGIIGISENWSCTLPIKPENGLVYIDFIEECENYINKMRRENKIDLMIVLTHSRLLNDQLLASKVKGIDILCGGHDHMYFCDIEKDTKTMIIKSGTDFKNVSWLQLQINNNQNYITQTQQTKNIESELNKCLNEMKGPFIGTKYTFINRYYDINMNIKPDQNTEKLVHDLSHSFQEKMAQTIGYIASPLDARFSVVRSAESTCGNFISDVIRRAYHCDAVIICGGALRADRIISAGKFTYKDILDIVPFQDSIVVIKLKGSSVIKALEHSVSGIPKAEGRFPQIAGIRFIYDPEAEIGNRIKKVWISKYCHKGIHTFEKSYRMLPITKEEYKQESKNNNNDIQQMDLIKNDEIYTIATREYLANGGDGFEVYKNETIQTIVDGEQGIPMSVILRNFFWAIGTVNNLLKMSSDENKKKEANKKRDSIMKRYSLTLSNSRTSLLQMEQQLFTIDMDANLDVIEDEIEDENKKENINEENDEISDGKYVNELTINTQCEHRIMTINDEIDMQSEAFGSMTNFFQKLPSFVGMKHLPRRQSLIKLLDDIEHIQSEAK